MWIYSFKDQRCPENILWKIFTIKLLNWGFVTSKLLSPLNWGFVGMDSRIPCSRSCLASMVYRRLLICAETFWKMCLFLLTDRSPHSDYSSQQDADQG